MALITFEDLPSTNTPLNANNLNNNFSELNNNFNQLNNKIENISYGIGTINNTYVGSAERNNYVKIGHIVSYQFTVVTTGIWDNTTSFISGLPKPTSDTRFLGINADTGEPMRFSINNNGEILNAYSKTLPTNNTIEGYIIYITEE